VSRPTTSVSSPPARPRTTASMNHGRLPPQGRRHPHPPRAAALASIAPTEATADRENPPSNNHGHGDPRAAFLHLSTREGP
jgi:hypothetical protein